MAGPGQAKKTKKGREGRREARNNPNYTVSQKKKK
jgi:hypothetical protein